MTAAKLGIVCPDGQYLKFTVAGGWVCSVGTPGPTGPQGPTGPAGPEGPQPQYANVVVVAKNGGNYTDPVAAINSITDASATNPYLVKIMPGVYDLGSGTLYMKEYVDIEGSGEKTTVITSSASGSNLECTVNGKDNAELRSLTVRNTGTGSLAHGIVSYFASPKLTNVTVTVSGSSSSANYSIRLATCSSILTNVTATASGGALENAAIVVQSANGTPGDTSPVMRNVTATALGGYKAYGIWNYSGSSPIMIDVTADASGNYSSIGIYDLSSSPTMRNVTAHASGGVTAVGIYEKGNVAATAVLTNVSATAESASSNNALMVENARVTMTNVRATANGGCGIAISSGGGSDVKVDYSTITGLGALCNQSATPVKVGSSKLDGVVSGANTCVASYNGNYAPVDAACQ